MEKERIYVLFVCLGNICRSPAAEGTFTSLVKQENLERYFKIDSAGTAAFHVGEPANPRARKAAAKQRIELHSIARQFKSSDLEDFDYILAMDRNNYNDIRTLSRNSENHEKIFMFRKFDPVKIKNNILDVPDPYYGGAAGFDRVQEIMDRTSKVFLNWIIEKHGLCG